MIRAGRCGFVMPSWGCVPRPDVGRCRRCLLVWGDDSVAAAAPRKFLVRHRGRRGERRILRVSAVGRETACPTRPAYHRTPRSSSHSRSSEGDGRGGRRRDRRVRGRRHAEARAEAANSPHDRQPRRVHGRGAAHPRQEAGRTAYFRSVRIHVIHPAHDGREKARSQAPHGEEAGDAPRVCGDRDERRRRHDARRGGSVARPRDPPAPSAPGAHDGFRRLRRRDLPRRRARGSRDHGRCGGERCACRRCAR